LILRRLFLV